LTGHPLRLPGYEGNGLYVWFDARDGLLSASIEWATNQGTPDAWTAWGTIRPSWTYYFVGKDTSLPYIIWPAELLAMAGSIATTAAPS